MAVYEDTYSTGVSGQFLQCASPISLVGKAQGTSLCFTGSSRAFNGKSKQRHQTRTPSDTRSAREKLAHGGHET